MKAVKTIIFFFILLTINNNLSAKHIVSGAMHYNCLGNNEYEITMVLHRDCNSGGAAYDDPAYFSIYTNDDNTLLQQFQIAPGIIEDISAEAYGNCPADNTFFCIQKTDYTFTVNLPFLEEGYTIAYQRCCWSAQVLNIEEADQHGITVMTEITGLGQQLCNQQYVLDNSLAFASCPGEPITLPGIPLYDAEGDSLAIEICFPLEGGGRFGTQDTPGDPNSCEGLMPTASCPPPYEELPFAPGFSYQNPFPTLDGIHIENNEISFTPTTLGLYIYGVCILEYRNGQLISQLRQNIFSANVNESTNSNQNINHSNENYNVWMNNDDAQLNIIHKNENQENLIVNIFNINGNKIGTYSFNNNVNIIDLQEWSNGIYFVQLNYNEQTEIHKIGILR